ncbi:MAG: serine hydrolase [Chloroflexota bacterium]|nr:serine hydrolase [Chloroflexota bacterium]
MTILYPDTEWKTISPAGAGFDTGKLQAARRWQQERAQDPRYAQYRTVVVRGGRVVAEWNQGLDRGCHTWLASASKSLFSSILGIVIAEGKIPSADARLIDFYPEALDVPAGQGPKEGRYAFDKDLEITFRQLISNTSGYMKPGELPGQVFHYQTYGMNVLTHAIAKTYGLYSIDDPEGSPGFKVLVDEKLRIPIGGTWSYYLANFDLPSQARTNIFGYYDGVSATALDMARLGWLWLNGGRWKDEQVIPEDWLSEAARTAAVIIENCPKEQWNYGYAFWTNDHGQLWPNLPRDSFAASGAGQQHIWVCPSLDLVVAQSPGQWEDQVENDAGLLKLVVDAINA